MDPQKLIDLLRATMEQQPEQRKAAEEQLTQVSDFFFPPHGFQANLQKMPAKMICVCEKIGHC